MNMKTKKKIQYKKALGQDFESALFQIIIIGGIILSAAVLFASLLAYYRPAAAKHAFLTISAALNGSKGSETEGSGAAAEPESGESGKAVPDAGEQARESREADDPVPYLAPSHERGNISDLSMENSFNQDSAVYSVMLDTAMGPMLYFNQGDSRWAEFLYGGADPMKKYGCGPAAVSMLVNSFSPQGVSVTPKEMAEWAAANGCYAPHSGSYHRIIPDSLEAFGLEAESVKDRSAGHVKELLSTGHVLAALMGKGALTDNGHFVLITNLLDNGCVHIADPNSLDNSTKEWDLDQLLGELKGSYDSGGPLWAVSFPQTSS